MEQRFIAVPILEELPLIGERVVSYSDSIIFEVAEITGGNVLVSEIGSEISLLSYRPPIREIRTFDVSLCRFPTAHEYSQYKLLKTV